MSRLHWTTPTAGAELNGSEYAWLDHIGSAPAVTAWQLDHDDSVSMVIGLHPEPEPGPYGANYLHEMLRKLNAIPDANWSAKGDAARSLSTSLATALRAGGIDLEVAGYALHSRPIELNTALIAGSDVVALAAKLFAWAEAHCWVEGPDRAWIAGLIRHGLDVGIYRRTLRNHDQGWASVLDLLDSRDDEPVVLHYSSGGYFPNPDIAGVDGTDIEGRDAWSELPPGEQWATAMAGLRDERPWAQLTPDTLRTTTFGPGVTVYDLFAPDRDDRVHRAFAAYDQTATV